MECRIFMELSTDGWEVLETEQSAIGTDRSVPGPGSMAEIRQCGKSVFCPVFSPEKGLGWLMFPTDPESPPSVAPGDKSPGWLGSSLRDDLQETPAVYTRTASHLAACAAPLRIRRIPPRACGSTRSSRQGGWSVFPWRNIESLSLNR
jgi:hypothetical protein